MKNILALLLWCVLSFSAGWFGSKFKPGAWYESLQKPSWTPPPLLFPIAWSFLYSLMGVSAWLVWLKRDTSSLVPAALACFVIQLFLNAIWSWIFFGLHKMGWAMVDMSALWVAVLVMIVMFWRVTPLAGGLMVPYLIWISFAAALNGAIWKNN